MIYVIDASAVFAVLQNELGSDVALQMGRGALFSAVNLSETLAKASDRGIAANEVSALVRNLEICIVAFDEEQANAAAEFRSATRFDNVSLADRVCLGLAKVRDLPILTADSKWTELELGLDIRLIR